ncbi:hypothetical protein EYF80_008395 [Liparis tanakae]|uniref:Uncharacterized protein n=1 Tax=Liparis tanakae TaxID=230148 RepID=A0A4Z2ITK7_9TELE|nr:hypothetical protein EYF80_008395 [Liparis tanakae]
MAHLSRLTFTWLWTLELKRNFFPIIESESVKLRETRLVTSQCGLLTRHMIHRKKPRRLLAIEMNCGLSPYNVFVTLSSALRRI